jgi:hypothetical protein
MAVDDLYWTIKTAAGTAIVNLDLPGIGVRVYGQLIPGDKSGYSFADSKTVDIKFPAVLLTSEGETEEFLPGDSEGIAGRFPQRCWIADVVDPGMHAKERIYLGARKTLMKTFHQQKLVGCPAVRTMTVDPRVIFDPRLPHYQFVVSGFVVRFEWGQKRYS